MHEEEHAGEEEELDDIPWEEMSNSDKFSYYFEIPFDFIRKITMPRNNNYNNNKLVRKKILTKHFV
jgi:hypothetical protein